MATHNVETENSAELLFWLSFLGYTWHKSMLYWRVSFITSSAVRLSFIGLTKWAYIPPTPWINFGRTIIATTTILGWTIFAFMAVYGLFLTPIHILISPVDIWIRNSTKLKVTKSVIDVHKPEIAKLEYGLRLIPNRSRELTGTSIFAIHGLGSSPDRAWTHYEEIVETDDSEEPGSARMRSNTWLEYIPRYPKKDVTKIQTKEIRWLQDFLPQDDCIREARIMMLNHDTRWDAKAAGQDFIQHATSMLTAIADHRKVSLEQLWH